jgi:hypothetical protein
MSAIWGGKALPRRMWQLAERSLVIAVVIAASAVMTARALNAEYLVDFYYLLVAGRMWGAGLDPYGPAFAEAGSDLLSADAIAFAYPPSWWLIAVPLASLETGKAIFAWKIQNVVAAGAAAVLLARSALRLGNARSVWPAGIFVLCTFTSDIMWMGLKLGQTSVIVLLGFAILITGLTDDRRPLQAGGLAMLMLKPQIGLLFLFLLAVRRETRRAASLAVIAAVAACLPILVTLGPEGTVESANNLLHNLIAYSRSPWNLPMHTSGLPHLLAYLGINVPAAAAIVVSCAVAMWMIRYGDNGRRDDYVVTFWLVAVAALLSIVPLHAYDFILFFSCLLLLPTLDRGTTSNLMLLSLALTWSATGLALLEYRAIPSLDPWLALRLKHDLLTASALALLGAAAWHMRSKGSPSFEVSVKPACASAAEQGQPSGWGAGRHAPNESNS